MLKRMQRYSWWLASKILGSWVVQRFRRRLERKLAARVQQIQALRDPATGALQATVNEAERRKLADKLIRLLLYGMSVVTLLMPEFRKANLPREFKAKLVFKTKRESDRVECSAVFANGRMRELKGSVADADATIVFKDGLSLFNYVVFSKDHDVVNLLLENQVEIDGNLSLVYKFMYMVRNLLRPLRIA